LGPERHKVFQAAAQAIRPCGAVSSLPVQPHARIPLLALYLSAASLTCSCARRNQTSAIFAAGRPEAPSGARYPHAFVREATSQLMVEPPGQVHRRGSRVRLVVLRYGGARTKAHGAVI